MRHQVTDLEDRHTAVATAIDRVIATLSALRIEIEGAVRQPAAAKDAEPNLSGETTVQVYWLNSRGLGKLATNLGQRVNRIGCTSEDLPTRISAICRDEYGAWSRGPDGYVKHDGFNAWMAAVIHTTRGASDPAISVRTRSIAITLPIGMTRRGFDKALHLALSRWSLEKLHPKMTRYTVYDVLGRCRTSRATELYTQLDPRHGDQLLEIVEAILKDYRRHGPKSAADGRHNDPSERRLIRANHLRHATNSHKSATTSVKRRKG